MSDKKISYLNRTFEDYRKSLRDMISKFYPRLTNDFDDASIGSWIIDMVSSIADNLSFHIDRVYNETDINSANKKSSIYALARSNGFKIPGPKASITEVKFTCTLPVNGSSNDGNTELPSPNYYYAPIIKKGTRLKAKNGAYFEVDNDIDFSEQFDENGISNREVIPFSNSNGVIVKYEVSKTVTVTATETRVYKITINNSMLKPFMEIIIPDKNIMCVDSIIVKDGPNIKDDPFGKEFLQKKEFESAEESISGVDTYRFFEVESLLENYRWGDSIDNETYKYGYRTNNNENVETMSVTKGEWLPVRQKFMTEYTDGGYLKVIFGGGIDSGNSVDIDNATSFTKHVISHMINNDGTGVLPKANTTMYIQYRIGGGNNSNIASNTLTNIVSLKAENKNCVINSDDTRLASDILSSIKVTNTIPSVLGKDIPTTDEIRNMMKYNNFAQDRCVTVKDYADRISKMPARYGMPFRVGVTEENNKIMIYLLNVDFNGKLTSVMPQAIIRNIENYLSKYRMINDYIEIKSGKVINIGFDIDIFVDSNYETSNVIADVIETVKKYMDINKHNLGEDIFIGDIEREISKVDGVINLIDMKIYNKIDATGIKYSQTEISQEVIERSDGDDYYDPNNLEINTEASDYILNSNADEMFEIKYAEQDIRVRAKIR